MKIGIYVAGLDPESGGGFTFLTGLLELLQAAAGHHEFLTVGLSEKPFAKNLKHVRIDLPTNAFTHSDKLDGGEQSISLYRSNPTDRSICTQLAAAEVDVIWYADPFHILTLEYPYFLTIWDLEHRQKPWFPDLCIDGNWLWREQHFLMLLQRAARIFTGTEAGRKELQDLYRVTKENIVVLPLPPPAVSAPLAKEKVEKALLRLKLKPGFLFYPAQFWPHKNHINLLHALRLVKDESGLTIDLVLTGSDKGNLQLIRKTAGELQLQDQIHFPGFVSREDLHCLYQGALALVFVSYFGPDNLPPLEAFAERCPVIASRLSGAKEQMDDAALLVDPSSPRSIASAILSLARDEKLRQELIQKGIQRASCDSQTNFQSRLQGALAGFEPFRRCWSEDFYQQSGESGPTASISLAAGVLSFHHESELKDKEILRLRQECESRLQLIQKQDEQLKKLGFTEPSKNSGQQSSSLLPGQEALPAEATPEEILIHKSQSLLALQEMVAERELFVSCLPIFDWAKLGRKVRNIFRYHARKFKSQEKTSSGETDPLPPAASETSPESQLNPEPAPQTVNAVAPAPFVSDLTPQIAIAQKGLRIATARYYHLESLLLAPPLWCPQAFWLKCRTLLLHPLIFFGDFIYKKWAKHGKNRLGVLHQSPPVPMAVDPLPSPQLDSSKLPTISIVTPSYKQAIYIEQTLSSVLAQNYPKLDYHVQDGGSTDGTVVILRRFEDKLSSWVSAPDKGQSDAIIKGFERSSGELMAWLNSDDILLPGALRFVAEYFATHPEVDVVYGHRIIIDEHGQEVGRWFLPKHDNEILKWADYVPQETLFWRRQAWEKVGGLDPNFHFALDWDLLLRFQKSALVIHRLPYFLGGFRVHSAQKTSAAIGSTGKKEMDILRLREHGKFVSQKLIDLHVRVLVVRSAFCALFWRWGIRL